MDAFTAWCAGFFDGEGSISIRLVGGRYHRLVVRITQSNKTPLHALKARWGGEVVSKYDIRNDVFDWRIWGPAAAPFLKAIRPLLLVKGRKTDLALSFLELGPNPPGKRITQKSFLERERFRLEISSKAVNC